MRVRVNVGCVARDVQYVLFSNSWAKFSAFIGLLLVKNVHVIPSRVAISVARISTTIKEICNGIEIFNIILCNESNRPCNDCLAHSVDICYTLYARKRQ